MMPAYADTSFFLALLIPADAHHQKALRWWHGPNRQIVLTEFVLLELGNALSRPAHRRLFLGLLADMRADPQVRIIPASPELFGEALALFGARLDQEWSLVDCASFVTMKKNGLADALTLDSHFVQAGFNAMLL
jgi:uncharacterized protein